MSEATQQNTLVVVLTNTSVRACWLLGYPTVALHARDGRTLPFTYARHGDQMVSGAPPTRVTLAPHGSAYVALNKLTCIARQRVLATRITLYPPGGPAPLDRPLGRYPMLGYCPSGDPGSVIDVSAITADERHALSQHP